MQGGEQDHSRDHYAELDDEDNYSEEYNNEERDNKPNRSSPKNQHQFRPLSNEQEDTNVYDLP